MTGETISLIFLAIGTIMAVSAGVMARHASRAYRRENTEAKDDQTFNQKLIALEILGLPGDPEYPSLRHRLRRIHDRQVTTEISVQQVKLLAEDSHKELHPNGGGSMRDDVTEVRRLAEQAAENARQAVRAAETLAAKLTN